MLDFIDLIVFHMILNNYKQFAVCLGSVSISLDFQYSVAFKYMLMTGQQFNNSKQFVSLLLGCKHFFSIFIDFNDLGAIALILNVGSDLI